MAAARLPRAGLAASERLDVLAAAPLSYRLDGRERFQIGGGLYCASLLLGLAGLGHRVRALASGPRPSGSERPEPLGPGVSVEWFALDFTSAGKPPPASYVRRERARFESALGRALAEHRPDVVLLGSEAQAWYAAEPCRERGLPTMLVSHGVPTAALPAGIYPPQAARALVARLGHVDSIATVAHHLEAILRSLGLARVTTVGVGVDAQAFRPRQKNPALLEAHGIERDRFVIGSFSQMRPEKRILDIVRSAEHVLRAEPRALYLVAGDGPDRKEAVAFVAERGLGDGFRFVGELDHAAVPAYMALSDVVVLASEREGCSLVCREAQACGRALVVSDIPAGREVTGEGKTGLLFRLGDVDDLAAKTLQLARDPRLRRRLAGDGRTVSRAHTRERWIERCSEVLVRTAGAT
jgi:glycosyltransferase involved in cell wall biosynthesis